MIERDFSPELVHQIYFHEVTTSRVFFGRCFKNYPAKSNRCPTVKLNNSLYCGLSFCQPMWTLQYAQSDVLWQKTTDLPREVQLRTLEVGYNFIFSYDYKTWNTQCFLLSILKSGRAHYSNQFITCARVILSLKRQGLTLILGWWCSTLIYALTQKLWSLLHISFFRENKTFDSQKEGDLFFCLDRWSN